jgi:3-hydroxybutyryl-CoA dehydratase
MEDIFVGASFSLKKTFSRAEVDLFSNISNDANPIHFDVNYAKETIFNKCIVQGPYVISIIGGILGSSLPGPGTIYLKQTTKFLKPVFVEDTVIANVEVLSIRKDKPVIVLRTWIVNQHGEIIIDGEAVVLFTNENYSV